MDRGDALLQGLLVKLKAWGDYIRRATHATEVLFQPRELGEFTVVVRWKDRKNTEGEYQKDFTRPLVFGGTYTLTPLAWSIEKRACDYARDIVQEILRQRGVL